MFESLNMDVKTAIIVVQKCLKDVWSSGHDKSQILERMTHSPGHRGRLVKSIETYNSQKKYLIT